MIEKKHDSLWVTLLLMQSRKWQSRLKMWFVGWVPVGILKTRWISFAVCDNRCHEWNRTKTPTKTPRPRGQRSFIEDFLPRMFLSFLGSYPPTPLPASTRWSVCGNHMFEFRAWMQREYIWNRLFIVNTRGYGIHLPKLYKQSHKIEQSSAAKTTSGACQNAVKFVHSRSPGGYPHCSLVLSVNITDYYR